MVFFEKVMILIAFLFADKKQFLNFRLTLIRDF
jgi:hypothetical protein